MLEETRSPWNRIQLETSARTGNVPPPFSPRGKLLRPFLPPQLGNANLSESSGHLLRLAESWADERKTTEEEIWVAEMPLELKCSWLTRPACRVPLQQRAFPIQKPMTAASE